MDNSDDKYFTDLFSLNIYYYRIDSIRYVDFPKTDQIQGDKATRNGD